MREIKRVCVIDSNPFLVEGFKRQGCEVLALQTGKAPFFDLSAALGKAEFSPELLLQVESLGSRTLITGLDQLGCPTIFWAVDPHLNAHWHNTYARLFDLVCSTQRAWIPPLKEKGAEDVRWLPWYGRKRQPTGERQYDMAFVGRISGQRSARKWMIEFLKEKGAGFSLAFEDNLKHGEMLELYEKSRIIPNESILGEINFRLFEGASCGCLVLGQDLGPEQEELFEKGREMDTYSDIVEMDEKLAFYLGNKRLVETMGRAAQKRVESEHLPFHRAGTLLEYGRDAARRRATGRDAEKWFGLTVASMWEESLLSLSVMEVLDRLAGLEQSGEVLAAVLRVQAKGSMNKVLAANVQAVFGQQVYPSCLDLNLAGSMGALRVNMFDAAKGFWLRHAKAASLRPSEPPRNPAELLTLWAKELLRQGRGLRMVAADPAIDLPATAGECLMARLMDAPEHLPTLRLLDTILRPVPGMEQTRVGFLSILTLHERNDWRLAFEIGLANLKSYRLDSGLEELVLARDIARKQGQERLFLKALESRNPSGLILPRLERKEA